MDKNLIRFLIQTRISDIIFNQHMKSKFGMTVILIRVQFASFIACILFKAFTNYNTSVLMLTINLLMLLLVVLNNFVHDRAWEKAKKEYKINNEFIDFAFNIMEVTAESEDITKQLAQLDLKIKDKQN